MITDGATNGVIQFTNSATAGNLTVFTNGVGCSRAFPGNHTDFFDTSSAGSATFYNNGTDGFSLGNFTSFFDSATADNAVLIANGSTGSGFFFKGETIFNDTSDAGNATLIANPGSNGGAGGSIEFFTDSTVPILAWRFSAMVTWTLAGTTLRV